MYYTTLIDVPSLAAFAGSGDVILLDCRFDLARPSWGEQAYAEGHISGARFAHLDRDLASPRSPASGRHPLPTAESFAAAAGRWGVDERSQVVAYDQGNGMYAARAWWLFRWVGHTNVAVLDGGLAAWTAAGQPLTRDAPRIRPRRFAAKVNTAAVTTVAEVKARLAAGAPDLIDARAADRFAGQNETIDPVAGHVPGAINHPFTSNLGPDGRFLPAAALQERWLQTFGPKPATDWVAMCGSGVSACHNLLAMEHAGLPGAKLFAGSWSEWIRDPQRPVATGER